MSMQYNLYCPNCSCKVIIEEYPNNYVIIDSKTFKQIERCPDCDIRLILVDGELKEDRI